MGKESEEKTLSQLDLENGPPKAARGVRDVESKEGKGEAKNRLLLQEDLSSVAPHYWPLPLAAQCRLGMLRWRLRGLLSVCAELSCCFYSRVVDLFPRDLYEGK